ncbi:TrbI/VirB10 family protein [Chromobacterium vaccinii]|uniref:TrbI/VirB10 family protein n=1 Tax=Chromobacterium vaccinii TaxID=1108595 RepID=UPI0034586BED
MADHIPQNTDPKEKAEELSREDAIKQWEEEQGRSAVASTGKNRVKGVLIVLGALVGVGALVYLKPTSGSTTAPQQDVQLGTREGTTPGQKPLASAPASSSPQEIAIDASAPAAAPTPEQQALIDQKAAEEKAQLERATKLRDARLKSAIVVNGQGGIGMDMAGAPGANASQPSAEGNGGPLGANNSTGASGAQDANSRYFRSISGSEVPTAVATKIDRLPYKILQGKQIDAVLVPRIISDLPGTIRAMVQRDVYGEQGRIPLLPWGTRLIGTYNAELRKGQERIFTVWQRAIRPDGGNVMLDSPGADQLGSAGMGGQVDNHFVQIFGTSALISIIGAGASNAGVNPQDQNNSSSYYREQVQQAAAQTSQQLLNGYAAIPPTIKVPVGANVKVLVNRDIDFTQLYKGEIEAAKKRDGVTVW